MKFLIWPYSHHSLYSCHINVTEGGFQRRLRQEFVCKNSIRLSKNNDTFLLRDICIQSFMRTNPQLLAVIESKRHNSDKTLCINRIYFLQSTIIGIQTGSRAQPETFVLTLLY